MIVAKITNIGFIENDNQTKGFDKICRMFYGMTENAGCGKFETNKYTGFYDMIVADNLTTALGIAKKQIVENLSLKIENLNQDEFFFRLAYEEVKNGLFLEIHGTGLRKYRLSDFEVI